VLNFTRAALELRRQSAALRRGECEPFDAGSDVLAFERRLGDERLWWISTDTAR
jgi:glycosidase